MHLLVLYFKFFFVFVSVLLFKIARKSHILMAQPSRNLTCGLMRTYMKKIKRTYVYRPYHLVFIPRKTAT